MGKNERSSSIFLNNGAPLGTKIHPSEATAADSANKKLSMSGLSWNQRTRLRVGFFMQLLYVELFFISLVVVYGGMVFVQMSLPEEDLAAIDSELSTLDLVLGSALMLEIILKLYAFGGVYLKNCWNAFDAVVVVLSFILSIVSLFYDESSATVSEGGEQVADASQSSILFRLLRLRVVLRLFRVLVVFERIKARSKAVGHLRSKGSIASPLEHVLRILAELRCHPGLHPRIQNDIEYVADIIKSNRLYDTGAALLEGDDMDADTQQWLRGEVMKQQGGAVTPMEALEEEEDDDERYDNDSSKKFIRSSTEMVLNPLSPAEEAELSNVLSQVNDWTFNCFKVEEITKGNALSNIGMYVFNTNGLRHSLKVDMGVLSRFFKHVQDGYIATNPYHNAIHGADVMQTVNYFITRDSIKKMLTPLDRAVALLSGAVHDFRHNGVNNAFHIATSSSLAIRYNDMSVLENYHVAEAFALMNSTNDCNVFGHLGLDDLKYARRLMIELVLGTDMSTHFHDVAVFNTRIVPDEGEPFELETRDDKWLLMKLALHTSDVSNPAKSRVTMLKWTDRVVEEFFRQGDQEKELQLPVSAFMDRDNCSLMKQQLGFIDYIVGPLFELWAQVADETREDCLETLGSNRKFWEEQGESFTPADMKPTIKELTGETIEEYALAAQIVDKTLVPLEEDTTTDDSSEGAP